MINHQHNLQGYSLSLSNGQLLTIYGALLCLVGHIPAIGGFKEGVGFALRKCRMCLATGSSMSEVN